jgi:hypothetical protein
VLNLSFFVLSRIRPIFFSLEYTNNYFDNSMSNLVCFAVGWYRFFVTLFPYNFRYVTVLNEYCNEVVVFVIDVTIVL